MPNDANQTAERQQSPLAALRATLEGPMKAEIAKALPPGIDPDRFVRTAVTAVQMNPDLLYADRRSLFGACMKAAQDGLLPDGREAVLNIYNTKQKQDGRDVWVPTVQYLPMVRGVLKTVRNSGQVASVDAAAVYAKDHFVFRRGDDPRIEHEPYMGEEDPGQVIAAYIIVKLDNGETHREVMPRRDIEKTRAASKSGDGASSPWTKWYDQMAIKAVIKRAAKLLPTSSEALDRVIQHDNEESGFDFNQRGVTTELEAPTAPAPKAIANNTSSRLADIVGRRKQAEPVPTGQPEHPADGMPPWEGDDNMQEAAQ
jgi:recombination protein RecT